MGKTGKGKGSSGTGTSVSGKRESEINGARGVWERT